jgi:putative phosphoesterase
MAWVDELRPLECSSHDGVASPTLPAGSLGATLARSVYCRNGLGAATHKGYSFVQAACVQVHGLRTTASAHRSHAADTLKICIVSDSHDRAAALLAAVDEARDDGAQAVIHCGDVIGPNTLRPLLKSGLPVHVVHGNNLGDIAGMSRLASDSNGAIVYHGAEADFMLAGRRIYLTHLPHQARGMACTGDYDLVCCGHTHEAAVLRQPNIKGGQTWIVNPGTVAALGAPARWILGDLAQLSFEVRNL